MSCKLCVSIELELEPLNEISDFISENNHKKSKTRV